MAVERRGARARLNHLGVEIVRVRIRHAHLHEIASPRFPGAPDMDDAIDLRRVRGRSRDNAVLARFVDQHGERLSDLTLQPLGADALLHRHEARPTFLLHLFGDCAGQRVRRGAFDGRVSEAADAVELRFFEEREELLELRFGLSREIRR